MRSPNISLTRTDKPPKKKKRRSCYELLARCRPGSCQESRLTLRGAPASPGGFLTGSPLMEDLPGGPPPLRGAPLVRMASMKRSQAPWYAGSSISGVSRRKVKERILGSSACGKSSRASLRARATASRHGRTMLHAHARMCSRTLIQHGEAGLWGVLHEVFRSRLCPQGRRDSRMSGAMQVILDHAVQSVISSMPEVRNGHVHWCAHTG